MLLDLGGVTRTLINLIRQTVTTSPAWPAQPLNVSPLPPDKISGGATIGIYLYHVSEDPQFKNTPPPPGNVDLRFTPMALNLSYVLSAHADVDSEEAALLEQLMMGLAIKGLRDYPIVDDDTRVGGVTVLDGSIANAHNRLRLVLHPVPASEAVSYWTAGQKSLRLSAYYHVSVIMLEPDEAPARTGRVLRYGVNVFVTGPPHLDATQSTMSFLVPGESTPRSLLAQPAQVAIGDSMTILGTGLSAGAPTLLVRGGTWPEPLEVDPSWGGAVTTQTGLFTRIGATAGGQPMLPGVYSAIVRVTMPLKLPDGSTRDVSRSSNAAPFIVVAGITTILAGAPAGVFNISGTGFAPAKAVQVFIGATKLVSGTFGSLNPGEFAVPTDTSLQVRLPGGLPSGSSVQLRILVGDAESAPRWLTVP